ncbi:hypothetical protein [Bartonella sp. AP1QHHD]|uniref:hypothetical protein n=1 Tax=Bartonella sp. AP1QHHD TaxID=3243474 RepID=UPI0035CF7925
MIQWKIGKGFEDLKKLCESLEDRLLSPFEKKSINCEVRSKISPKSKKRYNMLKTKCY